MYQNSSSSNCWDSLQMWCTFCQNLQKWLKIICPSLIDRDAHFPTRQVHRCSFSQSRCHILLANRTRKMLTPDIQRFQNQQFLFIFCYSSSTCSLYLKVCIETQKSRLFCQAVSLNIYNIKISYYYHIIIILLHLQLSITTMSRKQKDNKSKHNNSKQQSADHSLTMLSTAKQIQIQLPLHLSDPSIDQNLLKYYIFSKLIKKTKVSKKQPIFIQLFGKQTNLNISKIKKMVNPLAKVQEGDEYADADQVLHVTSKSQVCITFQKPKQTKSKTKLNQIPKFYGTNSEYENFKKIVWQNFKLKQKLFEIKLGTIRGIIIGGPTGTGKSTFIKRLQIQSQQQFIEKDQKIYFHVISATQLLSRVVGGAQEYVRKTFKTLATHKYSIFVIQDMHLLFGQKELQSHQTTLATLFSEMDNFQNSLIVIGTYNSERDLSSVVFQSGRFEKQITLNLPNHHQRLQILKSMFDDLNLTNKLHEDEIKQFNLRLNGFSIGQIKQILRDAFIMKGDQINRDVLLDILKQYRPSQIKQLIVEVPEVYWSGIGGYESVKHQIRKVTEFPLKYPQKFQLLGIQPSKGVLLYGPPGCSKTMMAKAIATQSKLNFIGIKGPELFSKYVGESERAIRNVFRKARAFSPCIIFFDEIDALASQRNDHNDVTNRLLGQLLTEMDGVEGLKQVIIIAATNRPQILDQALTRPGRFDHLIYVGPPDVQARKQIFKICLQKTPMKCDLVEICEVMALKTQNYTGAQITLVCRQAALAALEQNIQNPIVTQQNLQFAVSKVKNRLTQHSIARYEQFSAKFKNGETSQLSGLISAFGGLGFNSKKNDTDSQNPIRI